MSARIFAKRNIGVPVSRGRARRNPHGWTTERRARQSALIRNWKPWLRTTGPKTEAGKAKSAMNALTHGMRSRAVLEECRQVRSALRRSQLLIDAAKLLIRRLDAEARLNKTHRKIAEHSRAESAHQHTEHMIDHAHDAGVDAVVKNPDERREHEPPCGRAGNHADDGQGRIEEARHVACDAAKAGKEGSE